MTKMNILCLYTGSKISKLMQEKHFTKVCNYTM